MADTFGDHMSAGSGKRPAPTIEGTATEVTVDPAPDETASPAVDPAPDGAASPDPAVEAEAPDAEGSKPKRPKGPPPRTSPTELKSFVTHLAAGLLGGLIGVVGLALAWNMIPLGATNAPDLTPLESRLAKLEIGTAAGWRRRGARGARCAGQDIGRAQGGDAGGCLRAHVPRDAP